MNQNRLRSCRVSIDGACTSASPVPRPSNASTTIPMERTSEPMPSRVLVKNSNTTMIVEKSVIFATVVAPPSQLKPRPRWRRWLASSFSLRATIQAAGGR
jgi:hypothetical protein